MHLVFPCEQECEGVKGIPRIACDAIWDFFQKFLQPVFPEGWGCGLVIDRNGSHVVGDKNVCALETFKMFSKIRIWVHPVLSWFMLLNVFRVYNAVLVQQSCSCWKNCSSLFVENVLVHHQMKFDHDKLLEETGLIVQNGRFNTEFRGKFNSVNMLLTYTLAYQSIILLWQVPASLAFQLVMWQW